MPLRKKNKKTLRTSRLCEKRNPLREKNISRQAAKTAKKKRNKKPLRSLRLCEKKNKPLRGNIIANFARKPAP